MIRALALLLLMAFPAAAQTFDTSAGRVEVTRMAGGLDTPWAVAFLPGGAS
nr:hypothetical protein [Limibaculum sediminis]